MANNALASGQKIAKNRKIQFFWTAYKRIRPKIRAASQCRRDLDWNRLWPWIFRVGVLVLSLRIFRVGRRFQLQSCKTKTSCAQLSLKLIWSLRGNRLRSRKKSSKETRNSATAWQIMRWRQVKKSRKNRKIQFFWTAYKRIRPKIRAASQCRRNLDWNRLWPWIFRFGALIALGTASPPQLKKEAQNGAMQSQHGK